MNTTIPNSCADEIIIKDEETLHTKQALMARLRSNSLLSSISETLRFIAAPLFVSGTGAVLLNLTTAAAATTTVLPLGVGIGLLAASAVLMTAAVTAGYYASRTWQGNQFDMSEFNAQEAARHLAKALHKETPAPKPVLAHEKPVHAHALPEYPDNKRADDKLWANEVKIPQSSKHLHITNDQTATEQLAHNDNKVAGWAR